MTKTVVYGVDIAVITLGINGQPIGRKKFAWARLAPSLESGAIDPLALNMSRSLRNRSEHIGFQYRRRSQSRHRGCFGIRGSDVDSRPLGTP